MSSELDQQRLLTILSTPHLRKLQLPNPHNSILLYITGLSNDFDFAKARCDHIGGSPPDIDTDYDALDREKVIEWVVNKWGRENVANIITHGTFKPKSLARSFYRVTEGNQQDLDEILKAIPPAKFGKDATLAEIVEVKPSLTTDKKYSDFYHAASKLENMVSNFGMHAAGIVISDFPISDVVPVWKNSKVDAITQFDKDEAEELGLLKFDFLGIDTLSIMKETTRLIKESGGPDIDIYAIEDGDKAAYSLLQHGLTTGIFQMEASGKAKQLLATIKPTTIEELSDISSLNRPGPMQAKLDVQYIDNKAAGYPPEDMPTCLANMLKSTHYTIIYQETVMQICSELAGFTLQEADDIRRSMGKKKVSVLNAYKTQFIAGCATSGLTAAYADDLWETLVGFADYCLAYDTKVLTLEYGPIEIGKIVTEKLACKVLSLDETGQRLVQKVEQWHNRGNKHVIEYTLENDTSIRSTPEHKFMTQEGTMEAIETIYTSSLDLMCNLP